MCGGFEKASRLTFDHAEVIIFRNVGVVRIVHLQHFAFAQSVGGVGQGLHNLEVARPARVGCCATAAHFSLVNNVIVHEGRRVKDFDHGTEIGGFCGIGSHCAGHQNEQGGAHALAAGCCDVVSHFVDAGNGA